MPPKSTQEADISLKSTELIDGNSLENCIKDSCSEPPMKIEPADEEEVAVTHIDDCSEPPVKIEAAGDFAKKEEEMVETCIDDVTDIGVDECAARLKDKRGYKGNPRHNKYMGYEVKQLFNS